MFSRFERLLKPTDPPEQAAPPPIPVMTTDQPLVDDLSAIDVGPIPVATIAGAPLLVTATSAMVPTVVSAVALSFAPLESAD
jgi:hypothetical protein